MATKKMQKHRLNDSGEFDIIHYETEAGVVTYDNTNSGLAATDTQAAIDELREVLDNISVETDAIPTEGSEKPIQSGAVYTALEDKQEKLTGVEGQIATFDSHGDLMAADMNFTVIRRW